ncbi:MAG: hypothetical protein JSU68_11725, partial [Phycisphaerales bacterium]
RRFVREAVAAYLKMIGKEGTAAGGAEPWKTDGRKWHLSQKSMSPRGRKRWGPQTLAELAGRIAKAVPQVKLDWGHKIRVELGMDGGASLGKLVTNSREGIKVELRCPRGLLTPTRIERLGLRPQIVPGRGAYDTLRFFVRDISDVDNKRLTEVLRECRVALAR